MFQIQLSSSCSSIFSNQRNASVVHRLDFMNSSSKPISSLQFRFRTKPFQRPKSLFISCKSHPRNSGGQPTNNCDEDGFFEAFVLFSETHRHHNLRKQGFLEETKWHSSDRILQAKQSKADVSPIGHEFLRRFQSPTIFLKIACDGDLLLPIIVGEFAIEKLIDTFMEDENGECPNQFEFVKNLVGMLGYEVKMVKITERVVNTYYARIYLRKQGEKAIVSVDARPSDAINVAERCKAPIYVSKQVVSTDAIRIVWGKWRGNNAKSVYDVSLDSAAEGPDLLSEELDLVTKMNVAVIEERFKDAAIWRDELTKLRISRREL